MPADWSLFVVDMHRLAREAEQHARRQNNGEELWREPFSLEEIAAAKNILASYRWSA